MQIGLWNSSFNSLGVYTQKWDLGIVQWFCFNFFWKCHTIWHTGSTILQPYLQHARVPISLRPCQHLLYLAFFFFFDNSHPERCEVIPHSGFDLLKISNIDNVYIYPLAIYVFMAKCPFKSSAYFLSGLFTYLCFCLWVVGILYIFWHESLARQSENICSHSVGCFFTSFLASFAVHLMTSKNMYWELNKLLLNQKWMNWKERKIQKIL